MAIPPLRAVRLAPRRAAPVYPVGEFTCVDECAVWRMPGFGDNHFLNDHARAFFRRRKTNTDCLPLHVDLARTVWIQPAEGDLCSARDRLSFRGASAWGTRVARADRVRSVVCGCLVEVVSSREPIRRSRVAKRPVHRDRAR